MKTLLTLLLLIPSLSWGSEINLLCEETIGDRIGLEFNIDINLEKKILWDDSGSYYIITNISENSISAFRELYKSNFVINRTSGSGKFYNSEGGTLKEYQFLCKVKNKLF